MRFVFTSHHTQRICRIRERICLMLEPGRWYSTRRDVLISSNSFTYPAQHCFAQAAATLETAADTFQPPASAPQHQSHKRRRMSSDADDSDPSASLDDEDEDDEEEDEEEEESSGPMMFEDDLSDAPRGRCAAETGDQPGCDRGPARAALYWQVGTNLAISSAVASTSSVRV